MAGTTQGTFKMNVTIICILVFVCASALWFSWEMIDTFNQYYAQRDYRKNRARLSATLGLVLAFIAFVLLIAQSMELAP